MTHLSTKSPIAIVLGLGFGDEGKGSIVDWLIRRESPHGHGVVVRYNGGAQAAHHVVAPDGRTHCFAQLGAGSLVPGTRTHMGARVVIDPLALHIEAAALAQAGVPHALGRVTIDPRAVVVTPWHALTNRLREQLRGPRRHGSTGRGIAEAELDAERGLPTVRAGDVANHARLLSALKLVRMTKLDQAEQLVGSAGHPLLDQLARTPIEPVAAGLEGVFEPGRARLSETLPASDFVVLEGAQGILLDREHGFFPHVATTQATRAAAEQALVELGLGDHPREVWGVTRAYHTRHGDGPFPSESDAWRTRVPEQHNGEGPWQGAFRVGPLDTVLARHGLAKLGAIDRLVVNAVDRIERLDPDTPTLCEAWDVDGQRLRDLPAEAPSALTELAFRARPCNVAPPREAFLARIEAELGRRIDVVGRGPRADQKQLLNP
jgi:adenylosuccinate synthase